MNNNPTFSALVVSEDEQGHYQRTIQQRHVDDLPPGEVLIRVAYSSLNYKDALSASGNKGVTKKFPHTPGIDAAGIVAHSSSPDWHVGEKVVCTGYDLGMNTAGGFGQYIRVPGEWIVRLPVNLSLLEAMQLGTAGFTAALCVSGLQANNILPGRGQILVTGATGGVGSIVILMLHKLGYDVIAVTGKMTEADYLIRLGATRVVDRDKILADREKTLLPALWSGVVDTVGGALLETAIKATGFDGVVTCCGNAASADLRLNVYPFILRGVHLLGIYSANCPMEKRQAIWNKLAGEWKIKDLDRICHCIPLSKVDGEIQSMLAGQVIGRCVIEMEEIA